MPNGLKHCRTALMGSALAAALAAPVPAIAQAQTFQFNIPSQPLDASLRAFARTSRQRILFDRTLVRGRNAPALFGQHSVEDALGQLLAGTGLSARRGARGAYVVTLGAGEAQAAGAAAENESAEDEEIVVTGTNIPQGNRAAPVTRYSRSDIERSGAATVQQFMETLPQNFGGGATEDTQTQSAGLGTRTLRVADGIGSDVNLRGLGSTLVLIDGRRVAPAGGASFTDVSLIPLSAIERIEVLTDGASAIYGSDAVGGVVNFILRRNYSGAETMLRAGTPTRDGGGRELQASQTFGVGWAAGRAMLNLEYYDRTQLSAADRGFATPVIPTAVSGPRDLVAGERRYSAYGTLRQQIGQGFEVSVDANYTRRPFSFTNWDGFGGPTGTGDFVFSSGRQQQYGVNTGGVFESGGWRVDATATANWYRLFLTNAPSGIVTNETARSSRLINPEIKISGTVFSLPAGDVRIALGGAARWERFRSADRFNSRSNERTVRAGFAELLVPILAGQANESRERLLVSLAARLEDYSDFGSTFDPQGRIRWQVVDGLVVQGSYGTSFQAPTLSQLSVASPSLTFTNVADPTSPTGITRVLSIGGSNPDLQPQTGESWTAGFELTPDFASGLRMTVNYYNNRFANRIGTILIARAPMLNDPAYADLVTRRSELSSAEFDALVSQLSRCPAGFTGATCANPASTINAILDRRITNLSTLSTEGIDVVVSTQFRLFGGQASTWLNANYVFNYSLRDTGAAPLIDYVNTAGNLPHFRARLVGNWTRGGWSVSPSLSYVNDYSNRGAISLLGVPLPTARIDAWLTADLDLRYRFPQGGWTNGLEVALNVRNIFNSDPPFFEDGFFALGYDPANADPFGRRIALTLRKSW